LGEVCLRTLPLESNGGAMLCGPKGSTTREPRPAALKSKAIHCDSGTTPAQDSLAKQEIIPAQVVELVGELIWEIVKQGLSKSRNRSQKYRRYTLY